MWVCKDNDILTTCSLYVTLQFHRTTIKTLLNVIACVCGTTYSWTWHTQIRSKRVVQHIDTFPWPNRSAILSRVREPPIVPTIAHSAQGTLPRLPCSSCIAPAIAAAATATAATTLGGPHTPVPNPPTNKHWWFNDVDRWQDSSHRMTDSSARAFNKSIAI